MEASTSRCPSLLDLYNSHRGKTSDKWASYLNFYNDIFRAYRDRPIRLLEIGVQNGGSLDIWRKFFPNAELILGCDVNVDCKKLVYDDERVALCVGNANSIETFDKIKELSESFDIIIDDGSHRSSDIIKSFALYFPILSAGGLYVAEDLHCSYWAEFEGGLEAPFSSLNFFKRVSDLVNNEHWGGDISLGESLSYYRDILGIGFDDESLGCVLGVQFRNSVVTVSKGELNGNSLGRRVVVGESAEVWPIVQDLNDTLIEKMDEKQNEFGPNSSRLEEAIAHRRDAIKQVNEIENLKARNEIINQNSERLIYLLNDARNRPLKQFKRLIVFRILFFLSKPFVPLPESLKSRLLASALRRDPRRKEI